MLLSLAAVAFAQTESERFDIERFNVEGNTLLAVPELESLLRPFTGKQREYGDVQRALEALELLYRERGFSAVQVFVPEQELGGTVKLQVIESSIRRIRVQGAGFFEDGNVRNALPALREGGYPNAVAISENVQLANENPARQVDVVLKGTDEEGLIDVDVNVTDSSPPQPHRWRGRPGQLPCLSAGDQPFHGFRRRLAVSRRGQRTVRA